MSADTQAAPVDLAELAASLAASAAQAEAEAERRRQAASLAADAASLAADASTKADRAQCEAKRQEAREAAAPVAIRSALECIAAELAACDAIDAAALHFDRAAEASKRNGPASILAGRRYRQQTSSHLFGVWDTARQRVPALRAQRERERGILAEALAALDGGKV